MIYSGRSDGLTVQSNSRQRRHDGWQTLMTREEPRCSARNAKCTTRSSPSTCLFGDVMLRQLPVRAQHTIRLCCVRPLSRRGRSCGRRCSLTSKERWGRCEMPRIPGTGSVCYGFLRSDNNNLTRQRIQHTSSVERGRKPAPASRCQCNAT